MSDGASQAPPRPPVALPRRHRAPGGDRNAMRRDPQRSGRKADPRGRDAEATHGRCHADMTLALLRANQREGPAMSREARHVHRCTRTKPLHTPCRCRCGAERVCKDAYGIEVPRTPCAYAGRWRVTK